jgi:hypothetical protein
MYVGITTGGVLDVPTSSTVNGFYPLAGIGAAELSVSPQIYESCRINAASCLFQNTTSSLNKDGTVKAYVVQTVNNAPWDTITNQLVAANDAPSYCVTTITLKKACTRSSSLRCPGPTL